MIAVQESGVVPCAVCDDGARISVVAEPRYDPFHLHVAGRGLRNLPGFVFGAGGFGATVIGRADCGEQVRKNGGGRSDGGVGGGVEFANRFGLRMDLQDRGGLRPMQQCEIGGGDVVEFGAEKQDAIGRAKPFAKRGVHANAEIARVVRVVVVDVILPPEGDRDGRAGAFRQRFGLRSGGIGPLRSTAQDQGPLGGLQGLGEGGDCGGRRGGRSKSRRAGLRGVVHGGEDVFGQGQNHGAGTSGLSDGESAVDVFGEAVGALDLGRPFHQWAEEGTVVDLLKHAPIAVFERDLPNETDQRRCVMHGDMKTRAGVCGAGPARDEDDTGLASHLAVGLGHHRGTAFLTTDDVGYVVIVQAVQRSEEAFARHRKHPAHAVKRQPIRQNFAAMSFGHRPAPPFGVPMQFVWRADGYVQRKERALQLEAGVGAEAFGDAVGLI